MLHRVPLDLTSRQFANDRERLLSALEAESIDVRWYTNALNPYPFALSQADLQELEMLAGTVHRAVAALVPAWFKDWRIRRLLPLPEPVAALLLPLACRPYRTGAIRPDFLLDQNGVARISEINARFPVNGFLISHLLNRVGAAPIASLGEVPGLLDQRLEHSRHIGIVKGREAGWDIRILQAMLGSRARLVSPTRLAQDEQGYRDAVGPLEVLVLEVHQAEILATPALHATDAAVLNDLRTIFIAHDKRLLSVLCSDIARDYVNEDDVRRLHRHVIPTVSWGVASESLQQIRMQRERWIIKPATAGKGEGIVMGRHCTSEQWCAALRQTRPDSVLQPYIEQRPFDIATMMDGRVETLPMRVVGMLPILDGRVLGPGIYRASQADIVNVIGGGTVLMPMVLKEAALAC